MVRHLFEFGQFRRVKYIRNQMASVCYKTAIKKYYSYNSKIKYVNSTIKYIDFELFHYAINLYIILSFMIFNDFDYKFSSIY